jgi:hypothetical protein
MGTFGVNPFGTAQFGGGGSSVPGTGVQLSTLLYAAFRIAGITDRPGRTPSTDQINDAIPTLNRMIGLWNIDRLIIFGAAIDAYTLVPGQKIYQIGPGAADFPNAVRPTKISRANIIYNTVSPVVREPVRLLSDTEWAEVQLQDIPGTIPWALYLDDGVPFSTFYLYGQALAAYQLELYTWKQMSTFAAATDQAILPSGYEEAIVWNLAIRIAAMFPTQQKIIAKADEFARQALAAIERINAVKPVMRCDPAITHASGNRARSDYYAYLTGDF